ncbi:predicted protein [Botrytis cinerea T4]|uniref:Uncharacterized protein n=1 Tax=Botryotinia fuckeliana (strain T4) TaxID=999810 RepID=G2YTH3_BOTF4|nr:predicted protein [Botrytis cinerea T4]
MFNGYLGGSATETTKYQFQEIDDSYVAWKYVGNIEECPVYRAYTVHTGCTHRYSVLYG